MLVTPLPKTVKEWTDAGFAITVVFSLIAPVVAGNPRSAIVLPVAAFALLMTSSVPYHRYDRTAEAEGQSNVSPVLLARDKARLWLFSARSSCDGSLRFRHETEPEPPIL